MLQFIKHLKLMVLVFGIFFGVSLNVQAADFQIDIIKKVMPGETLFDTDDYLVIIDRLESTNVAYDVLHYLDDTLVETFTHQSFPVQHTLSYEGVAPGAHDVKIVVQDQNGQVVQQKFLKVMIPF